MLPAFATTGVTYTHPGVQAPEALTEAALPEQTGHFGSSFGVMTDKLMVQLLAICV